MNGSPEDILAIKLASAIDIDTRANPYPEVSARRVARVIIADPQGHIDALVEAGVLEKRIWATPVMCYMVVQPKPPETAVLCQHCEQPISPAESGWWFHLATGSSVCRWTAEPE